MNANPIIPDASVQASRRSGLLDSPSEAAFDRLTRLAATLLHAPISLVTVLDDTRQFYKSHYGLSEPLCSVRESAVEDSFCQFVVRDSQPLRVSNASVEEPFCHLRKSEDLEVGAYLGVPLTLSGVPFGALCVIDRVPRAWDETDLSIVTDLAQAAITEVELREAHTQLSELVEKQNEFLGMAAHDLRTPLSVVLGYSKLLASDRMGLDSRARRMAEGIVERGNFMLSLVDDLLDLEALKSGHLRLDLEEFALKPFLTAKLELQSFLAEPKQIALQLELPDADAAWPPLRADRRKLEQVLNNLLSNAIKYSPNETTVVLRAELDQGEFRLTVRDQGYGIEPSRLATLFEPFRRGLSHGQKGTGLGLAIAKKIVEGHGGRLEVQSAVGEGTSFLVALPASTDPSGPFRTER